MGILLSGTSSVICANETHRLCQTSSQNEPMSSHMGSTRGAGVGSRVPLFRRLLDVLVLWVPSCLWLRVSAASSWSSVLTECPVILTHTCTHQTHMFINTHACFHVVDVTLQWKPFFFFSLAFLRVFCFCCLFDEVLADWSSGPFLLLSYFHDILPPTLILFSVLSVHSVHNISTSLPFSQSGNPA